jgi:VanZ family protein
MPTAERRAPLRRGLRALGIRLLRAPAPLIALLAAAWAALIWWLSSHRVPTPARETFLGELISNLAHAPLFGLLGLWVAALVLRRELRDGVDWPDVGRVSALVVLALIGGWGALDEWHQSRVPGRDASPFDVLTDLVGAGMVLWVTAELGAGGADRALWRRLGLATLACLVSAILATLA